MQDLPQGFDFSGLQYAVGLACAIDETKTVARIRTLIMVDLSGLC